jgi:hypothetical protein
MIKSFRNGSSKHVNEPLGDWIYVSSVQEGANIEGRIDGCVVVGVETKIS